MKKPEDYTQDGGTLKAQLAWRKKCIQALSKEEYRFVSTKNAWLHYYCALRTFALYTLTALTIYNYHENPLIWIPCTIMQGCWLVNFIFLGHDGIHQLIFEERTDFKCNLELLSARFYGLFCHVSMTFFREYHGQHHHRFFRGEDDPKSTHFVPRDGKLGTKLAYFGPGLIKIFFGLRKAVKTVSEKTLRKSEVDKMFTRIAILTIMATTIYYRGFAFWMKIHAIPHMITFPIVFMTNRCGQHYCCDPEHAPLQSTPMAGSYWSDLAMFYSEYHVEHHTFAEVPAYNLKYLNSLLKPRVYKKDNMPCFTYPDLVKGWLLQNRPYYTVWWDLASTF